MTWYPLAFIPPQIVLPSGVPYSGAVLKAYAAETTTPIPMATNFQGTTTALSFTLNAAGYPVSGGQVIIPHIQEDYKLALYPTQAAADANSGAVWTYDDIQIAVAENTAFIQYFSGDNVTTAFTLSSDLGVDENALMIFADKLFDVYATNGTFATDTIWTKGAGWTIAAGVATAAGAISTAISQPAAVTILAGEAYIVTMVITQSAGTLTPSVGGTAGTARSSSGTYTETIIAGSTQTLAFTGAGFTGTLDNVVIHRTTSAHREIFRPNEYTLNGTSLTFVTAPASGTNNILVFAPSLLFGAVSGSVAAAAISETNAATSAATATTEANAAHADRLICDADVIAANAAAATAVVAAGSASLGNIHALSTVTPALGDEVPFADISNSNLASKATFTAIAALLSPILGGGAFKNLVIGGDFTKNPWQRGTTFTGLANAAYSADRFLWTFVGAAVVDFLKTADAPTLVQAGVFTQHCLQADCTTVDASIAATDTYSIRHKVEGLNASHLGFGQTGAGSVTLSFWHKHTKTGTFCVAIKNSAANRSYVAEYIQAVTDTWELATVTIPADTSGTWLYDNGVGLDVHFTIAAGSNFQATVNTWSAGSFHATANQVNGLDNTANNFKLALIQLESGTSASGFENLPEDVILQRCRRYYWRSTMTSGAGFFAHGIGQSTTAAQVQGTYPVAMRAKPTLETTGTAGDYQILLGNTSVTCNSVPSIQADSTVNFFDLGVGAASGMADKGPIYLSNLSSTAYLGFNAEL